MLWRMQRLLVVMAALLFSSAVACPVKQGRMANGSVAAVKAFTPICKAPTLRSELDVFEGLGADLYGGTFAEVYHLYQQHSGPARDLEAALAKAGYRNRMWRMTPWGKVVEFEYPNDGFRVLRVVYVTGRGGSVLVVITG